MSDGPKGLQEYLHSYNVSAGAQQRQTITVTDLISEGPIEGLVDGQASIYLNDDRAAPLSQAATPASLSKASISLTNNSATATISDGTIVLADNGKKYLIVKKGQGSVDVTATDAGAASDNGVIHCTLTAGSSFFTTAMVSSPSGIASYVPCRLVTTDDSDGESNEGYGEGSISKRTSGTVVTFIAGEGSGGTWKPSGTYSLEVDKVVEISSISGSTVTLASAWAGTTGSYKYDVTGTIVDTTDTVAQTQVANYEALTTQFRVGTKSQAPFVDTGGHGSTSISNSPSAGGTIEQTSGYGDGTQAAKELLGSSSAGFNLSAAQLQEVDEARVTWAYAGGHYAVSGKGNNQPTFTQYSITFQVKKPGETSFENTDILNREIVHSGEYVNAVTFVQKIDLDQYRPFIDFKLTIKRMSNHTGPGYKSKGQTFHDWQGISSASITNTTCIIKDKLSHPYCAMAKVGFTSQQFQGMPKRGYHARGLKVKVPSNYVTREENAGVSAYTRNVSTGVVTSTYQDWDGAFRRFPVYTNNPAWVFYDILTNNRYGLGDFLEEQDIDKYMLYRIARYCDELVDDGKGGTEPRFTCNLYFQKQADAYKVIKDIATVFRSMVYYFDGQVSPIMDAPSGPVYNFTKANVIDGAFSYEGTGSKTRINQCVVSWIDPDANYKVSPLLVEDRKNIADTGKIISQNSVAMGAITEGQALRYGRWKLWTAANQREVVSFKSALNSSFILPGDIINVQDADRYSTRYGGRVSNSGTTRSTTSIPLDSSVTLLAGSTYTLSVLFEQPGAFATESVTINSVDYVKGDLIKQAYIDSNGNGTYTLQDIDTEEKAVNAKATSGGTDALVLNWSDTHRVETQTVTTSSGATDTITVDTAFTAIPNAESIWVLTETTTGGSEVKGSAKEYKVLAISQDANSEYSFTAVEHYDEKFAAVDEDFTTFIADTVYPAVRSTDVVPPVKDVRSSNRPKLRVSEGGFLSLSWTPPTNVGEVEGRYEHLTGYEIVHNFGTVESPIRILDPNRTNMSFHGLTVGNYKVAVRVINVLNNVSEPVIIKAQVSNKYKDRTIPRLPDEVPNCGTTSVGYTVDGNTFKTKKAVYSIKNPGDESSLVSNTNTTATAWQQDCSNLPNITWSESDRDSQGEFITEHAYILLDASDTTDRFKLLKYYKPTGAGTAHWYDTGTGNTTNRFGSALTGTFTKAAGSSKVTGSGTAFTTQIEEGDVLKLGSEEIRVSAVDSNTVLYLERASDTAHSGVSGYIPNIRIDYINDVIIARVYKTSSGLVLAETYSKIDAVLKPAGDMIEAGGIATEEIAENAVTVTEIDTSAATGGTFGAVVAAIDAASFSTVDTDVLNANSVIAREVQVFPVGGTAPTISGTTLAGAGIDLKQDGDLYVGNAAANKYMFWDQSEGVMTFRGTLNAGDITAGTITADRIAVGSLDADKITANTITADEIAAGAITTATLAADAITAEKIATNAITADAIAAGTITATEIAADAVTASKINVANLAAINANIGAITAGTLRNAGTNYIPDAEAAPSGSEKGAFLDLTAGKMIFGDANKYIWWDGTDLKLNGVTINASQINTSAGFATQAYVTTAISNLVNGADGALDTLGEIATALGNDAALNTTLTTSIATKLPKSGGAMTGAITTNSTFDGRNVSVDGTKLDAIEAGATADQTNAEIRTAVEAATDSNVFTDADHTKLNNIAAGATNVTNNNQIDNGAGYITSATSSTTQSAGTSDTSIATTAFVTAAITAIGNGKIDWTADQGSTNIHSGNYINTTYSVGDGGLTQKNFTTTLKNKLDGIEAGANNYSFPYTVSSSAGNSTVVQRHSSGYIFANYFNTTPNTVTSGVTQVCVETGNDGYIRHGTAAAIRTFINVADGANNYTHPSVGQDMGAALTGANVISDVNVNGDGHVTGFSTRALTLSNLGYTGDSDATNGATTDQANAITANTAKTSYPGYAETMLREDNRIISPSELTSGRLKFGFTSWGNNNTSPYADFLHMRSYTDSSGGSDNMVMFKKSGIGMRIWQQTYASATAYSSYADVWTSGDFTSTHVTNLKSANLTALAGATTMPSLSVDFLEAGTINANHITANTIDAGKLTVGNSSSASASRLLLLEDSLKIFSGSALRVHIGNLANTDDGT